MHKENCWEFKKCGREPGGTRAAELGVCPAALECCIDGANGGHNGGRGCWVVTGSLCGGQVQGAYLDKLANCMKCDFYKRVLKEEGLNFETGSEIMQRKA